MLTLMVVALAPAFGAASADVSADTTSHDSIGWIVGRVAEKYNGSSGGGAHVMVRGTAFNDSTDSEGQYEIAVSPGTYDIVVTWGQYLRTVPGVQVLAGLRTTRNVRFDTRSPDERVAYDSILRVVQAARPVEVDVANANSARVLSRAWSVWLSGRGHFAIKQTPHAIDSPGPFHDYLLIQDGGCLLVQGMRNEQEPPGFITTRVIPRLQLTYSSAPLRPSDGRARAQYAKLQLLDDDGKVMFYPYFGGP